MADAADLLAAARHGWNYAFGRCPEQWPTDRFVAWQLGALARNSNHRLPTSVAVVDRHDGQVVGTVDGCHAQLVPGVVGMVGRWMSDVAVENWMAARLRRAPPSSDQTPA